MRLDFTVLKLDRKDEGFRVSSSRDVYNQMVEIKDANREMMFLLFIDSKNKVLKIETHSIGCIDSSSVYPGEIFKSALLHNASGLIMVHNHPSGDVEPSACDKQITKSIVLAGRLLGIRVLDHVIIGDGHYFSFGDQGLIQEYELSSQGLGF